MNKLSQAGLQFIKSFEGFKPSPYLDSAQVPTIGYGTIVYDDGTRVTMDDPDITEAQGEVYLQYQIEQKTALVDQMLTYPVNQNQYDALISFAYNLGVGALHGSTLLDLVNKGDFNAAANEFPKWNHANHVVVSGLVRRRAAEQALFLTPVV